MIAKDCSDKPIKSPVVGLFSVDTGGNSGGYNDGIDKVGDAVESCDRKVAKGSTPSLKISITSPQSPLALLTPLLVQSVVNDGVVIDAREPSGEIQLIVQGIEFSVILVREEKRADDVLFTSDNIRCVGPDNVVENHGAADVVVDDRGDNDVTSEIRGASSKGVLATVAFVHD